MTARLLTLCFAAIMLTAASARGQVGSTTAPGASPRGTIGMHTDAPGTNSLGTAQSVGRGGGQAAASVADDPALKAEDRKVDKTINSICRGC